MADPLHEYTVQEVLNKTNNYNTYQYQAYEGTPGIGASSDKSSDFGITTTNAAQELTIIDLTTGGATGPLQLTINDGDAITLVAANLPFTWDKLPITKIELGSTTVNDDLGVLAYFN